MNAIALIIGNSDYEFDAPYFSLNNPRNDAQDLANELTRLGFNVKLFLDLNEKDFNQALHDFSTDLDRYANCLFYFAGHAIQIDGVNYLAATDTSFVDEPSAKYSSVNLDLILEYLGRCKCNVKIVILDACRNNPFKVRGFKDTGLAPVKAPAGTIIAFSTSPGERAMDGGFKNNSIYTGALMKHIADRNVPIEEMFKRVRTTVYSLSAGNQISWEHTSLMGDFYFNSGQLIHSVILPYADEYVADANYVSSGSEIGQVISGLRSYTWNVQRTALTKLRGIDKAAVSKNERFLLGRNILQTAVGGEFTAVGYFDNLNSFLEGWFDGKENHVLNGILYEMYFNSQGLFRGSNLKTSFLDSVCKLEENTEYAASFDFINELLLPYRDTLFYIPSKDPQTVPVECIVTDESIAPQLGGEMKPVLKMVMIKGVVIFDSKKTDDDFYMMMIAGRDLPGYISRYLSIPERRLNLITREGVLDNELRVPCQLL